MIRIHITGSKISIVKVHGRIPRSERCAAVRLEAEGGQPAGRPEPGQDTRRLRTGRNQLMTFMVIFHTVMWIRIQSDPDSFRSVDPDPDPDPEV